MLVGYAPTVSNLSDVLAYFQNQREHHQAKTFKEEFLTFLVRQEVEYQERYLWN